MIRTSRRRLLTASVGLASVTALVACGSSSGSPAATSSPATTSAAPSASGTLTVWTEDYYVKIFEPLVKGWETKTGIDVTFVTKDFNEMGDQFVAAVPAGTGPDLFISPSTTAKFVSNGVVAPVELGGAQSGFNPVAIQAFTQDGKLYGVPFTVENIALYRNTELAPDAPATFDDLARDGKALVSSGKAKSVVGIGLDPKGGNPYLLMPLQSSFGSTLFGKDANGNDDPTQLTISDEAGQAFARKLAEWGKDKVINPNLTLDVALKQFTSGDSPYFISGPWDLGAVKKSGVKYAIDKIPPAGPSEPRPFAGFYGVYQSAKAKNPLAASLFLSDFMTAKDNQVGIWKEAQNPPALTAAFDEISSDADMKAFGEMGKIAFPTPGIGAMDQLWGPWGETEMLILRGRGGDPAKLWTQMGDKIKAAIEKQ